MEEKIYFGFVIWSLVNYFMFECFKCINCKDYFIIIYSFYIFNVCLFGCSWFF